MNGTEAPMHEKSDSMHGNQGSMHKTVVSMHKHETNAASNARKRDSVAFLIAHG
jgi:hypothetical protein